METLRETIEALGPPMWMALLEELGPGALIARWRHADAHVRVSATDALRIVLSLSSTQRVRHVERGRSLDARGLPGHVSVFRAGVPTETFISGDADVVQVFIPDNPNADAASDHRFSTLFEAPDNQLKSVSMELFVTVSHGDAEKIATAQSRLGRIVGGLLTAIETQVADVQLSRLSSGAFRRVESLIEEAVKTGASRSLDVRELATAAELSVGHFIRAFRATVGCTPHQHVLTRRCEQAMELMRSQGITVAEISDRAGYGSPAHFIATFRKRFGVTPGRLRAAIAGEPRPALANLNFSIPRTA